MEVILNHINYKNFYDINMHFLSNKITAIYEENDSSLLEMISLLEKPKDGNLIIDDFTYNQSTKKISKKIRKKIGYMSKFCENQIFNQTVKGELELPLKLFKENYDIDLLIHTMQIVDLDPNLLERDPFTLSNGEMRKLSLATILVYNPDILILDNPFVGLDFHSSKSLYKLLQKLKNDYKKTIIISTNDIETLYKIADYVYIFKDNHIVLEGKRDVIYKSKDVLLNHNIVLPQVISFSDYVFQKRQIKLGYRYEINDLIKDIYRHV